jgi:hypothetical protein
MFEIPRIDDLQVGRASLAAKSRLLPVRRLLMGVRGAALACDDHRMEWVRERSQILLATLANKRDGCSDEMQTRPMALEASSFASSKKSR